MNTAIVKGFEDSTETPRGLWRCGGCFLVPPLSHRVVRKLVLAWKGRCHVSLKNVCPFLFPVISTYLYYQGIFWNDHCTLCKMSPNDCSEKDSGALEKSIHLPHSIFGIIWQKPHLFVCIEKPWKTCQAHSKSHYLKISQDPDTCLFSSLSMAGSGSSSRARSKSSFALCHGDHSTSWWINASLYILYNVLHLFFVDSNFWMECVS